MNELRIGAAEVVITPPLGISMAGYYNDRKADDIHDDLYAHALVLDSDGKAAALVVCDLIALDRELAAESRQMIEERTGIPAAATMICCTHTHTGPLVSRKPHRILQYDPAYAEMVVHKVADSVQLAWQKRKPAVLRFGVGRAEGISGNRRWWMKDGTLRTNPRFQDPELDHPAGPIDPQVGVVVAYDADAVPLAVLVNFALHSDEVGGTALGGDYQGVENRLLKRMLGNECVVLCPNGCCGDINHFDWSKPAPQSGQWRAERSGSVLAGEVVKRLPDLQPVAGAPLTAAGATIAAELRLPDDEEVAWAEQVAGGRMSGFDAQGLDIVRAHRILGLRDDAEASRPAEVSAITIGDVAIVGLPGEIFVELGLTIKEQSPFPYTMVNELCNDSIGYVPTAKAYREGGYEATSTPLAEGTGEKLVETALSLLKEARGRA